MDANRAKQIASSLNMIDVYYNGEPIYIENVNNDNITAMIHPINQHNKSQKVNISSLIEKE